MSDIKPQIQEAQRVPNTIHIKKKKNSTIPTHIIFKLQKIKFLKETRKKKNYCETKLRIISNFSEKSKQKE